MTGQPPWVQPSEEPDSQVRLRPNWTTGPAPALVQRAALWWEPPGNQWAMSSCGRAGVTQYRVLSIGSIYSTLYIRDHTVSICVHTLSVPRWLCTAYLSNKNLFSGVSNQEAECLVPLRWCGTITHLQRWKSQSIFLTDIRSLLQYYNQSYGKYIKT